MRTTRSYVAALMPAREGGEPSARAAAWRGMWIGAGGMAQTHASAGGARPGGDERRRLRGGPADPGRRGDREAARGHLRRGPRRRLRPARGGRLRGQRGSAALPDGGGPSRVGGGGRR